MKACVKGWGHLNTEVENTGSPSLSPHLLDPLPSLSVGYAASYDVFKHTWKSQSLLMCPLHRQPNETHILFRENDFPITFRLPFSKHVHLHRINFFLHIFLSPFFDSTIILACTVNIKRLEVFPLSLGFTWICFSYSFGFCKRVPDVPWSWISSSFHSILKK